MNQITLRCVLFLLILSVSRPCLSTETAYAHLLVPGVSKELATFRKTHYKDIRYTLFFSLPDTRTEPVTGTVDIRFVTDGQVPLILDFRPEDQIVSCLVNGVTFGNETIQEHLFIPSGYTLAGENRITLCFTAADQSLNRRDELMYTLLVPDRARTLFPCFDQPDLKSLYTLSLEVPGAWKAISNSPVRSSTPLPGNRKEIVFGETEPLSTYLFSFVAGEFEERTFQRDGRQIAIYHRETDELKTAQCPEIASEVFDALEWLEDYTGIPYPFAKYDLIILPGFQYGGMEHTGATLYNDRRMFLNTHPTLNERLSRSALIAHEKAHIWFGDYVTMQWFDDVWTKEVFANYFASRIVESLFPDINHRLNFISGYIPATYAEDRTLGSNPVKQYLDNMANAGLVYGNIIYNKSPIVMEMLVQTIGKEAFRKGIQEYLRQYAYRNADWNGLIRILDEHTPRDLVSWSHSWINEKGMPEITVKKEKEQLTVTQEDPFKRGVLWPQQLTYRIYTETDSTDITIYTGQTETTVAIRPDLSGNIRGILPNIDGRGYGFFRLDTPDAVLAMEIVKTSKEEVLKGSLLITLYENLLHGTLSPEWFTGQLLSYLSNEQNTLLFSAALGYISNCQRLYPGCYPELEKELWQIVSTHSNPQHRLQAFRTYTHIAHSGDAIRSLYKIWEKETGPEQCALSENDFITLSYLLAMYLPEQADQILRIQQDRISNPDRKQEYAFIFPAVSSCQQTRDSLFQALLVPENRRIEPWAATALSYLNHHSRQQEAVKYIRPALEQLQEVQRTGDIFFPTAWLRALLSGHQSAAAWQKVEHFFRDHPGYSPMLSNKIRQQADFLRRSNSVR